LAVATPPPAAAWTPDSWRSKRAAQQPHWPDEGELKRVHAQLNGLPPLVFAGEARHLTRALGQAAQGKAFVLQAGDCAESFNEFSADGIRDKLKVILQMAVVLTYGAGVPVVKVGRIAGQFAKPRTSPTEQVGDLVLDSFRGHMVNDDLPGPGAVGGCLSAVGLHPQSAPGLHQGWVRRSEPDPRLEPGVRGLLDRRPALR
jgi:3-deoxy-D-arabino-heptulosonate 7-phosphate (DAHP) synthase class II